MSTVWEFDGFTSEIGDTPAQAVITLVGKPSISPYSVEGLSLLVEFIILCELHVCTIETIDSHLILSLMITD